MSLDNSAIVRIALLVLAALVAVPVAEALPARSSKRWSPRRCPKDIQDKLVPQYQREMNASGIKIAACVWGRFGKPGWVVYHLVPWGPHSHAETAPDGGKAIVTLDGEIAATGERSDLDDFLYVVEAVDLDGDGTDEIVTRARWQGSTSPESGEELTVSRVVGDKIEQIFSQSISYEINDDPAVPGRCRGRIALLPRKGGGRRIVLTSSPSRGSARDSGRCPPAGKHVFVYADGKVTELE